MPNARLLCSLNKEESTIAVWALAKLARRVREVQNVRSFGTEGRTDGARGQHEVPMSNEIYDFIIFRGKDLKDLTVLQGLPEHNTPQVRPAKACKRAWEESARAPATPYGAPLRSDYGWNGGGSTFYQEPCCGGHSYNKHSIEYVPRLTICCCEGI